MGHRFTPEKFTFELVITPFITRAISAICWIVSSSLSPWVSNVLNSDIELCHKNIGCYRSSNLSSIVRRPPSSTPCSPKKIAQGSENGNWFNCCTRLKYKTLEKGTNKNSVLADLIKIIPGFELKRHPLFQCSYEAYIWVKIHFRTTQFSVT